MMYYLLYIISYIYYYIIYVKSNIICICMFIIMLWKCTIHLFSVPFNVKFEPKVVQLKIGMRVGNGRNCLGFLPMGFGKMLCLVINNIIHESTRLTLIVLPLLSSWTTKLKR